MRQDDGSLIGEAGREEADEREGRLPAWTGRHLLAIHSGRLKEAERWLCDRCGLRGSLHAADFAPGPVGGAALAEAGSAVLDRLGVIAAELDPDQLERLGQVGWDSPLFCCVEPERVVEVPEPVVASAEEATAEAEPSEGADIQANVASKGSPGQNRDGPETWNLQVVGASASRWAGRGVRLAVLDTGVDFDHPDFRGRTAAAYSFLAGAASAHDRHGHGTFCAGIACGPTQPAAGPRYAVAPEAELYVAKVLDDTGRGTDLPVLAAMEWALLQRCAIVSMSLSGPIGPQRLYSRTVELAGRRAMVQGTLLIAAAGNDSRRPGRLRPVAHPANCPSVMGVGALDRRLGVAPFSNASFGFEGGQVDIAAPGVAIRSAWLRPGEYATQDGTSAAVPHVAGVAALLAEADPEARGERLWALVLQYARRLEASAKDVGAGLAQAPSQEAVASLRAASAPVQTAAPSPVRQRPPGLHW